MTIFAKLKQKIKNTKDKVNETKETINQIKSGVAALKNIYADIVDEPNNIEEKYSHDNCEIIDVDFMEIDK